MKGMHKCYVIRSYERQADLKGWQPDSVLKYLMASCQCQGHAKISVYLCGTQEGACKLCAAEGSSKEVRSS